MMNKQNIPEAADSEKELLIERLKEIEEELYLLQRQNTEREQSYSSRVKELQLKEIESALEAEAKALKGEYPAFDVEAELENQDFVRLVNSGLPMKTAYEALHLDEIRKSGEAAAGRKALSEYQKAAKRPEENGVSLKQGGILKSGVHSLSKSDREDIAKRARRGEVIRF